MAMGEQLREFLAQADDVARVGLMFADSPWITGTVLPVDGGMLLKMPSRL